MTQTDVPEPVAWERLERDVVTRIRVLAAVMMPKFAGGQELQQKLYNDVVLPNLRLLGEFCASVQIEEASPGIWTASVRLTGPSRLS